MKATVLLCDIGNTFIKLGFANKEKVLATCNLPKNPADTADSLGLTLLMALRHAHIAGEDLAACVASSVVPAMDPILADAIGRYAGCPVFFVPDDLPVPLQNRYQRPNEVGSDRLVAAYAARRLFPDAPSIIVVDYGTAVTFDCIGGGAYLGGLIFPGPATALGALAKNTAKLPLVSMDISATEPVPCRDTVTSIQHGLIFGYQCLTEGLCAKLACQLEKPVKIIATGGFAKSMRLLASTFDAVLPGLLLDGLRMLYFENEISQTG